MLVDQGVQTDSIQSTLPDTVVFSDPKKEKKLVKNIVNASIQPGWFRPITRSKTGTLAQGRQSLKEYDENSSSEDDNDDDDDYDGIRPGSKRRKLDYVYEEYDDGSLGVQTCIPVHHLPILYKRLVETIKIGGDADFESYDTYAIQTLLLNCAMDIVHFKSEDQLLDFVKKIVLERKEFKISKGKGWKEPVPQPSYDPEEDEAIIQAYDELLTSEEQERLRSYRSDSKYAKVWTASDKRIMEKGFNSGLSNREISEQLGNNVHANLVTVYRSMYLRKQKRIAKGLEQEE